MPVSLRTATILLVLALAAGLGIGLLTIPDAEPANRASGSAGTASPQSSPDPANGLTAAADRESAAAYEQVTISGRLIPAANGVRLVVQRREGGEWRDFPAATRTADDGSYSVWVKSGRKGENTYRVTRPEKGTASPEVRVTVA